MSDRDDREDLATLMRAAKRLIERERASGAGELLTTSLAAARRGARARADGGDAESAARLSEPEPAGAGEERRVERRSQEGTRASGSVAERAERRTGSPPFDDARTVAVVAEPGPRSFFDEVTSSPPAFSHAAPEAPVNPRDPALRAAIAAASKAPLEAIAREVRACEKCALFKGRTQGVPGVGTALSGIAFVGEGPGADEDRLGEPFVGRAGQLLDRILVAMNEANLIPGLKLDRTTVFIGNVVHCRPPENRVPLPAEIGQSLPYLERQLEALQPRIICCLGKTAAETLLGEKGSLGSMRGKTYRWRGARLLVTYHPAACLRNPGYKRPVWEDMQRLAAEYLRD